MRIMAEWARISQEDGGKYIRQYAPEPTQQPPKHNAENPDPTPFVHRHDQSIFSLLMKREQCAIEIMDNFDDENGRVIVPTRKRDGLLPNN